MERGTAYFAATQHPDAQGRSAGGFSKVHPWVAGGFGRRDGGSRVADPQRRFSGPEGPAAEKVIYAMARSCADVTRSSRTGQAIPLCVIDLYAIGI
jgi:hypothetical protein